MSNPNVQPPVDPPNERIRDWPKQWVRDDKFWREVATRTVAGVLTAAIIAVFALVPIAAQFDWGRIAIRVVLGGFVVPVVFFGFLALAVSRRYRRQRATGKYEAEPFHWWQSIVGTVLFVAAYWGVSVLINALLPLD